MTPQLVTVAPTDAVESAVGLLRRRGIRHLLVLRKNRLVGIISDRDLKRALDPDETHKRVMNIGGLYFLMEPILVEEIMTPDPVTISPDMPAEEAAAIMVDHKFGALPVVEKDRPVGILTETDLLRFFAGRQKPARPAARKKTAKKKKAAKKATKKKGRKKKTRR